MALHGYIRVSKTNGRSGDRYISPHEQERSIRMAAARLRVELVEPMVVDEDVSGSLPAEKRRLGDVLDAIENGESEGIIVSNVDRLTRGSKLVEARIFDRLDKARGRFVAADENIDSDAPGSEDSLDMLALMARSQWRRYKRNWAKATRNAVERGLTCRAHVPFGYVRDPETRRLVVVPEEADALRHAYAMRAQGANWSEVAEYLNSTGLEPRVGWAKDREQPAKRRFIGRSVARMLGNDIYTGVAHVGELVNPDAHEPIVTRAEWQAAQSEKPGRLCRSPEGTRLAGIARCAGCGGRLTPSRGVNRYKCMSRSNGPPCTAQAYARMDDLDGLVVKRFLEHYAEAIGQHDDEPTPPETASLRRKLDHARDDLATLVADTASLAALSPAARADLLRNAQAQVDVAQAALDAVQVASVTSVLNVFNAYDLFEPDGFHELPIPDQRRLLACGIESVTVAKGERNELEQRVTITWRDQP